MIITSPKFRRLETAAALLVMMFASGAALAQSSGLTERTIPPSGAATIMRGPSRVASPAEERAPPASIIAPSAAPATVPTAPAQVRTLLQKTNYFRYPVKPGDSLSGLAIRFGIAQEELAKLNRLSPDAELVEGASLRVPNPFDAEMTSLNARLRQLSGVASAAENRAREAEGRLRAARAGSQQALYDAQALRQGAELMPWWRGAALGLGAAALLMFAVMAVTLFQWWRMRGRCVVLAEMAETLGR
ncbi:MAG: LysM peptidoglycan-binding domain-containing protein, partial [Candidatus Binataceae bacterium]